MRRIASVFAVSLLLSFWAGSVLGQTYITTVAGNGVAGFNGDGRPALRTSLFLPQDAVVGPDGNLYFTDWNNHRIRRLAGGTVETVAGTGELGEARDGPADEIQFNHPTSVSFDHQGRLLIAAWHNSKVKRLDLTTGMIENLAGKGGRAFGGDGGPGNEALLDLPSSAVVDSRANLLISDQANFRLRRLAPDGTIETICGTGAQGYTGDGGPAELATLNSPVGQAAPPVGRIAVDSRDQIYIADTGNHVIRLVGTDGIIRTFAGTGERGFTGDGGPATEAQLNAPSDVAVAADGTIYIADTMNNAIRSVSPDGIISTVAGTGEPGWTGDGGRAEEAKLNRPYGVTVAPNGDVYVADTHNHRLRRLSQEQPDEGDAPTEEPPVEIVPCSQELGSICTYAGTGGLGHNGDGRHRLQTILYWPMDIEFTPSGHTFMLDWNNHAVREILVDGTFTTVIGTDFVGDGPPDLSDLGPLGAPGLTVSLNHPTDVQEFPDGDLLLMAWHNHKIRVLDPSTGLVRVLLGGAPGFVGDGGPAGAARVNQPPHGVFDKSGNFFFIDQRNQRVRVIHDFAARREDATIDTVVGTGEAGFNGDGVALQKQVNFPAGTNPEPSGGITIDGDGVLYFADTLNHRIRRVRFEVEDFRRGMVTTLAGTGDAGDSGDGGPALAAEINLPQDLEIGPDGKLYFADTNNHRVRRIDLTSGIIEAVAGTGEKGYGGEGGPALEAKLNRPFGIAFDRRGDLYIADTFNSRIRRVKLSTGGPTPVFPADYRESYVGVRDCRFSIEHGGVYIRVLADELGASAYLENLDPLPVGTVIVKEEFSEPGCADDTLIAWRAMRKEVLGFDPEDGDWHWQKVLPGREVILETKDTCIGCHRRPDCLRRDYMCTEPGTAARDELRLVLERQPSTLLSVSGKPAADGDVGHDEAAPFDIYAVGGDPGDGLGPYVLNYDGARWRRLITGAQGDLWWITVELVDGAFYLAGENGLILRLDPRDGSFERYETPGNQLLFGVWGTDAQHVWAVGGDLANEDRGGVVWFFDGANWAVVDEVREARPQGIPTLYKVWGRGQDDVYAVGRLGVVFHFDGNRWSQLASNSTRPLFTVHGNQAHVVATGGIGDGVILESGGGPFVNRAPRAALQMNGVFLSSSGLGAAVGIEGSFALRTPDGWRLQQPVVARGPVDFHAVWIDPVGGIWAVGGDLAVDLPNGVLAYAGSAAIGRQFTFAGPCQTGEARGPTTVSYRRDIVPIFTRGGCLSQACHGGASQSDFDLRTYESTFGPGMEAASLGLCNIVPGVPRASYLLEKLNREPRIGARMPFGGTPLSSEEIRLIRRWIVEGAADDPPLPFVRGDADGDAVLSLSDAIFIFNALFGNGAQPSCADAADADDDGRVNITDGIYSLSFLFLGGDPPPEPFSRCGGDPTADQLRCEQFAGCE